MVHLLLQVPQQLLTDGRINNTRSIDMRNRVIYKTIYGLTIAYFTTYILTTFFFLIKSNDIPGTNGWLRLILCLIFSILGLYESSSKIHCSSEELSNNKIVMLFIINIICMMLSCAYYVLETFNLSGNNGAYVMAAACLIMQNVIYNSMEREKNV